MKEYKFWGWKDATVPAINKEYKGIETPQDLYDALSDIWCEYTCAPRLRPNWNENNKTLGQCSITSFLVQDIFGGKVYGVPLEEGGYHCYNVVDGHRFDLTSEQFTGVKLDYDELHEQFREIQLEPEEKKLRYEYLKEKLKER